MLAGNLIMSVASKSLFSDFNYRLLSRIQNSIKYLWWNLFAEIVNCVNLLTISSKSSITDLWLEPKYASALITSATVWPVQNNTKTSWNTKSFSIHLSVLFLRFGFHRSSDLRLSGISPRDRRQISLLVINEFKRINLLVFPLKLNNKIWTTFDI